MNPAELRGILRNDWVGLVLGVLIALPGLLTLGLVCLHRRRARLLLWPALFAILYGARLLIRTETFRLYRMSVRGLGLCRGRDYLPRPDSDRAVCARQLSFVAALLDYRRGGADGLRSLRHRVGRHPRRAVFSRGRE